MFNILKDIVNYTMAAGLDVVKIKGTKEETKIDALALDKSIVVKAKMHEPVENFIGTVGLPNLGRLNVILNIPEYREEAQVTVTRNKDNNLDTISFSNKNNDFDNTYRLMSPDMINAVVQELGFKEPKWDLEFEPLAASIQRLKYQAQAISDTAHCQMYTQDNNLVMEIGDPNSFQGKFVFHTNITGKLNGKMSWPVQHLLNTLSLAGDKKISFSNAGAIRVTVDSGQATYNYILPSQMK